MPNILPLSYIYLILGVLLGVILAGIFIFLYNRNKIKNANHEAELILNNAHKEEKELKASVKREAQEIISEAKKDASEALKKSDEIQNRLLEREKKLEERLDNLALKQEKLIEYQESVSKREDELAKKENEIQTKLAEVANLTRKEAEKKYMDSIKKDLDEQAQSLIQKHQKTLTDKKLEVSRNILLQSMQQFAGDVTNEVTLTLIEIPSDDIKGKLIGKEGRNITTFERKAGVSLIIDDTPDTVFISGFDLYRRYIAKKSIEKLIEDGRIQPARIEEVIESTELEAQELLLQLGQATLDELSIEDVPEEIIPVIGKLRFRTSYGQNMLKHAKEVAIISQAIARQLGVDDKLALLGGLLHDIGKALDHDIEGTHPEIGAKLGRKYHLRDEVVDMIENHHGDPLNISIYAAIVQIADAISSVRPGARREAIEQYIKRVQEMEALAQSFSGVDRAYALSAGREVRVFVDAKTISDMDAYGVAKNIANDIHEKLSYPGEVKVNVIRETRVVEFAK